MVLKPFSLFFLPRPAWHDDREEEICPAILTNWRGAVGAHHESELSRLSLSTIHCFQGFSRNTRHETRITAFFRITAFTAVRFSVGVRGVAPPVTSVRTTAPTGKSRFPGSPLFTIVHYCSALFGKKILPWASVSSPSAPATRPVWFSRNTSHETRRLWPPGRCFPARCGATVAPLWRGYGAAVARVGRLWRWRGMGGRGAAWAAYCPRASVLAPSAVLGRSHDEPRSLGNPTKVLRIPFPPGKYAKRIVPQLPSPCGSPHCRERQMNSC